MKKWLVNYGNERFREQQALNAATGRDVGRFDRVISCGPEDIEQEFAGQNRKILSQPRGNGYWLWKPYFIEKSLQLIEEGDFLFYCDSGAYFIGSIDPIIEVCRRDGQEVIPFELQGVERIWTKRDAFVLMNCDTSEFTDSRQRMASFSLWRKSAFAVKFARELLEYSRDERAITDLENQLGQPNYPGFKDHRHDQSIFSLLTKKHGLRGYRSPSQFGNKSLGEYPSSAYGQLICHTRKKTRHLRRVEPGL